MTITQGRPHNLNFLPVLGTKLYLRRLPTTTFFLLRAHIPGLTLNAVETPNPFVHMPQPGDHIDYEHLEIDFAVDEDLTNWHELHDWMRGDGYPESYTEYANVATYSEADGRGPKADGLVTVLDSQKRSNWEYQFWGLVPVSLSGFDLFSNSPDVDYVMATANFRFTLFQRERVKFTG